MLNMEGSTLLLRVEGELSIYKVEEINKQLCALFGNAETVMVDMSKVDKIDTAGFQLLVSLKQSCESSHKKFELNGTCESVQNFFTLFGLVLEDNEDYFGLKASQ